MKKQTKLGLVLAAAAVISVSVASLVSARGWVQNGADWYYVDNSGEYVTESIQASGNSKFYLGEDGTMQRDYFLEDYNSNAYYFGQNGAMVTNTWVAVESSRVENQEDYVPDNYWYYFQASGKAMKGSSGSPKKTTIDGKKYAFNEYGQMLTGWITSDGKVVAEDEENPFKSAEYYAGGDNDGVLRAGWLTYYDGWDGDEYQSDYTNLYFYFNTSNNKKENTKTKKINGRTYAFDDSGVMNSGWDPMEQMATEVNNRVVYFSGEDDGHQVKKGWVFAVPAQSIDSKAYSDDEEKYMYFNASGEILRDQFKRINGKYYVFSRTGIMKTGIVIWAPDTVSDGAGNNYRYIKTLDLDWQTGEELSKKGILRYDDGQNDYFYVDTNGHAYSGWTTGNVTLGQTSVKLHYFGSDGARKTGANTVEFADDNFVLNTNGNGDKGSGIFAKKYYSLGIQLKASQDIRYGIYNGASPSATSTGNGPRQAVGMPLSKQATKQPGQKVVDDVYRQNLDTGNYAVLNTGGSKVKGNATAKKDADGNYWLIRKNGDSLEGIWTVNVKTNATFNTSLKTRSIIPDPADVNKLYKWSLTSYDETNGIGGWIKNQTKNAVNTGVQQVTIASLSSLEFDPSRQPRTLTDNTLNMWFDMSVMQNANPSSLVNWKWRVMRSGNQYYLQLEQSESGYGFQSDVNDQSNKWIPYGILDNSKKSVCYTAQAKQVGNTTGITKFDGTAQYYAPDNYFAYEVVPNNDYFLNCYWLDN